MKITALSNPRQTILVTSRYQGKDNIITMDWHTPLSFAPMMYAIAVGKTRFSCDLIKNSKVFVVNFISRDFEKEEAEKIDCPRIKQALGFLECKVVDELEVGDHVLFLGEVLNSNLKSRDKRLFHLWGDNFTTTVK